MRDYIDRAQAMNAVADTTNILKNMDYVNDGEINRVKRAVERILEELPTINIDAVPISFIEEQVKLCNEIGFKRGEECYRALIENWRKKWHRN